MKKYWIFALAALWACEPEIDAPELTAGDQIDLSRYVAVGNSLTAGFADGGLYRAGQEVAYPNLMAQQFEEVGGGTFEQPLFSDGARNGSGYLRLAGLSNGVPNLQPVVSELGVEDSANTALAGRLPIYEQYNVQGGPTVQNLGVPGLRVLEISTQGFGIVNPQGFNPFFERIQPDTPAGAASYIETAAQSQPSFFSCWLGNNDVLGFATSGGEGTTPLTDPAAFRALFSQLLNALAAGGAEGVVANIPSVTATPFFTTVPYNALPLTQEQADQLNAAYAQYNAGVDQANQVLPAPLRRPRVEFTAGQNALLIEDDELAEVPSLPKFRQLNEGELVLLPASSAIPTGAGSQTPLGAQFVLTASEITAITDRTTALNTIIRQEAETRGLAVFDVNSFFAARVAGDVIRARAYSGAFITGGIFSLDGIHLTPFGNAVVTNGFLEAINRHYNASIPLLEPSLYEGVRLPN